MDDFIRTAPAKLLRQVMKDGGEVKDNSYKQLIDDYDKGIQVIEIDGKKESLSNYIIRMGGVSDEWATDPKPIPRNRKTSSRKTND